jgi:uncharacterized membrane protein YgcG
MVCMDTSRLVVVAAVLAAVGMTVVAPVAAFAPAGPVPQAGGNGTADNGTAGDAADNRTVNGSFGTQVTSFMQASAASANSSVESGVWRASVNRSAQPERAVENRAASLDRRLDRLQNRSEELAAMRERGEIPEVAYTARASAIRTQIDSLRTAISEANETATQVGVNTTRLDRLRDRAANMTGPEVAALARNITDVRRGPPPGAGPPNGTPPQAGPPGNGTGGPPSEGPPGNGTGGPPSEGPPGNGTTGPPGEGQPGEGQPGDGAPDDRGSGQDDAQDDEDSDERDEDEDGGDDGSDDGGSSASGSGSSGGSGNSDSSGGPGNS